MTFYCRHDRASTRVSLLCIIVIVIAFMLVHRVAHGISLKYLEICLLFDS